MKNEIENNDLERNLLNIEFSSKKTLISVNSIERFKRIKKILVNSLDSTFMIFDDDFKENLSNVTSEYVIINLYPMFKQSVKRLKELPKRAKELKWIVKTMDSLLNEKKVKGVIFLGRAYPNKQRTKWFSSGGMNLITMIDEEYLIYPSKFTIEKK